MGLILAGLGRIPIWVWAIALLAGWGYVGHRQAQGLRVEKLEQVSRAEANNRQAERESAQKVRVIADELQAEQMDRSRRARSVDDRLRALAAAWAASAASSPACGHDGAPAVAVLPEQTRRDLVALADEADAVAARLRACQSYIQPP